MSRFDTSHLHCYTDDTLIKDPIITVITRTDEVGYLCHYPTTPQPPSLHTHGGMRNVPAFLCLTLLTGPALAFETMLNNNQVTSP